MPKKLDFKIQGELERLIEKHKSKNLSNDERVRLHELIDEKYDVGDVIEKYNCQNCGKFLVKTSATGPTCVKYDHGCGFSYTGETNPVELTARPGIN